MDPDKIFNVRVYGLVINQNQEVLLSDEYMLDREMIKFPGGGLQFGEGLHDALKREFREEANQEIEIMEHFYTTHFFQAAFHDPNQQVISVYYQINLVPPINIKTSVKKFDFPKMINGGQSFRWVKIQDILTENISFPIDRKVAEMLWKKFQKTKT